MRSGNGIESPYIIKSVGNSLKIERTRNKIVKYIFIDWGWYMHSSIFAWKNRKQIPATYTCLTMILGDLRKVGVDEEDIIIIATDKGRSWRKDVDTEYKSTRKGKRDAQREIPWNRMFEDFNKLLDNLDANTPWHVVGINSLEADDIISYSVRYFKDSPCVIMSTDADFEQLFAFENVRIYSPHSKKKCYKKPPKNPYKIIEKKIQKEVSDDLVSPVLNEADYKRRYLIINLLKLPDEIERLIEEQLKFLPRKDFDFSRLPYSSLIGRFENIYKQDKVITFEQSMEKYEKKKKKRKQTKLI
jgi:hypothetical protein